MTPSGSVAPSTPSRARGTRRSAERAAAPLPPTYVAIDFETANDSPDSACAVALVRYERGVEVAAERRLVRPPTPDFRFTWCHGITWADVAGESPFTSVWRELSPLLGGAAFLAAHNAPFDRRVLEACCARARRKPPALPWVCTVQLARRAWQLFPTKLPNVAAHLGLELHHHEPLSDARACGVTVARAWADGCVPALAAEL